MEGTYLLVARAQEGDEQATAQLFNIIKTHHMGRYIGGYRGRNVLVSDDDIESEFLLGVWKALPKAQLDMGNPLNFMCWKGQKAVQSLFRNRIRKEVRYQCRDCHATGILGWKKRRTVCTECGSPDLYTWMTTNAGESSTDVTTKDKILVNAPGVSAETAWQIAVYGIQIEELRDRLDGRARDLFDAIVYKGINRDSSKNYLREIADEWGTATTAVAAALRRLRREVEAYLEEE